MNFPLSTQELRALIGAEKLSKPALDDAIRSDLGAACQIITEVGIPTQFADWFKCAEQLVSFPDARGHCYSVRGVENTIERAVLLGRSEFGVHVVDCDTGCIVYIDSSSGATQLVNTSIWGFLHFIALFSKAASEGFADTASLRQAFEEIDAPALDGSEGVWAVMLEEAEAGLY